MAAFMGRYFYRTKQTDRRRELRNRMTEAERRFWILVKEGRFYGFKFRRQAGIGIYIVDFYCPSLKLVIEIDGGYHKRIDQKTYDQARSLFLESFGLGVIRFTNEQALSRPQELLAQLEKHLVLLKDAATRSSPL